MDICKEIQNSPISKENESHLVFTRGPAVTNETLCDETFGVTIKNCFKMTRFVEMYLIKEKQHTRT